MRRPKTGQKPRGVLLVPTLRDPARDVETADAARGDEPSLGPAEPEQRVPEEQVLERSVPEQPVLEQPVLEQPVLEEPVDAVDAAVEPIARTAAPDEEPTEERGGIVPAGDRPPLDVAAMLRRFEDRTTASLPPSVRRFGRPVGFAVLLVGLALAGLLVGRLLRDSGDSTPVVAPTVASSTAQPKQPAPASARKPASDRWGPLRAMPAGRLAQPAARAAAVRVGDRVVVLGGTTGDAVQIGKAGGVLRPAASLPGVRAGPAAFVSGGAVYLIGGEAPDAAPSDAIVRFDPGTSQVTSAGSFVEPLAGAGYVQGRDSLFLVGGWTGTQYATAVLRFTLPDTASVVARLPVATRDMAVAVRGDTLYAAGGRTADGLNDAVYAVDLSEGTVETVGRLPEAVWGASLVVAGGQLYLLGGKNKAGDAVRSIVRIDPASGRIERAGTMPKPLAGAAAVRVGDATYLLGGTRPNSVIRLTPAG